MLVGCSLCRQFFTVCKFIGVDIFLSLRVSLIRLRGYVLAFYGKGVRRVQKEPGLVGTICAFKKLKGY